QTQAERGTGALERLNERARLLLDAQQVVDEQGCRVPAAELLRVPAGHEQPPVTDLETRPFPPRSRRITHRRSGYSSEPCRNVARGPTGVTSSCSPITTRSGACPLTTTCTCSRCSRSRALRPGSPGRRSCESARGTAG